MKFGRKWSNQAGDFSLKKVSEFKKKFGSDRVRVLRAK